LRKNYIQSLHTDEGVAIAHNDKEKVVTDYFSEHLGSVAQRRRTFDWDALGYAPRDLSALHSHRTRSRTP
jgi:hypothetical protein